MAQSLSILIVDDSEDDALLVARELQRAGFTTTSRRLDTADAMADALRQQPWDLILADYRMPHFSGPQALEVLQKTGLDIPFILVSGTVGDETAVAMMKAGANDFVLKNHMGRLGAVVSRELREAEMRRHRRWADAALEILAEAGKLAREAPDFSAIVERAASIAVPRLADWCIAYASDRSTAYDVHAVAARPGIDNGAALAELAREYPPVLDGTDRWFATALHTRMPVLTTAICDGELAKYARDEGHLRLLRVLQPRSLMVIPQISHDRVIGILVLVAQRPGRYGEADLGLATEVGRRVALVLENARLTRDREEFISAAVHEIKTPIAVIKTAVQLAQSLPEGRRNAMIPELLARLDRQCNRLDRLVTEVLAVSRLDLKTLTLARRPTDLAGLVEQVVRDMRNISTRHQLVIRRNDAVTIDADAHRLEEVLSNLISNAIKYSPAGGDVDIESRRDQDSVRVSVSDHGIGIPRDKQSRIFERFYRAHAGTRYDHASSLGVGLYLSNELVARHGGTMWFDSTEGVGSTFGFSLPLEERP